MEFFKKWSYYRHLIDLRYKSILILIAMTFIATISEALGLGLFYPIFQYINAEGDVSVLLEQSGIWKYIILFVSMIGMDISLGILLVFSFIAFFGRQFFMYIRSVYSAKISKYLEMQLSKKLFKNYLLADMEYYDSMPIGVFANIITRETVAATAAIMSPIEIATHAIMLMVFFSMLLLVSWEMTLASVVVLIIASRIPRAWIQQSEKIGMNLVNTNNYLTAFLIDRLKSPRLVRLAGTKNAEEMEFNQIIDKQRQYYVLSSILTSKTELILEPVIILLSLIFLYFSVKVLHMPIELIGLYLLISMRLLPVVKGTVLIWQSIRGSLGSVEAVDRKIKNMTSSKEKNEGTIMLPLSDIDLNFNSIYYSYPLSNKPAIKDVSFSVACNTITAIVGPSGGGKSTLIDLIPRLRTISSGSIEINGVNIEKYNIDSLRELVAYVPQNPQIFNGSVASHICYGSKEATNKEINIAASLAGANNFIDDLPDKYNTLVGEDATKLSGGQRQRLDLARALIKKTPLLILDEPTSNLDADSEMDFKNTLLNILKQTNTTIIIISHRLSGISYADQIIVLDKGEIKEKGTHKELIFAKGWYSKAWKKQT
jgi:ABC-type multidrug transport system fused ATPase/permease subunit